MRDRTLPERYLYSENNIASRIVYKVAEPAEIVSIGGIQNILHAYIESDHMRAHNEFTAVLDINEHVSRRRRKIIRIGGNAGLPVDRRTSQFDIFFFHSKMER